jgi:hypothetical protein
MEKMSSKMAAFFKKKGEKGLAKHEKREAEGKEKDTRKIAKKEEKALKGAPKKMREYEKKEHKEMGFKTGGAVTKKMAMGGRTDPRRSYGMGPGMAAMMGNGSRVALPGTPDAPPPRSAMGRLGSGMAKGGGVESKGKTQGKSVSMKKKYV